MQRDMQSDMQRRFGAMLCGVLASLALVGCGGERVDSPQAKGQTGKQVWAMACARCHGPRGAGDGPKTSRIGPVPTLERTLDPVMVRQVVMEGRGQMPPHAKRLSAAQIDAVVKHVATFAP